MRFSRYLAASVLGLLLASLGIATSGAAASAAPTDASARASCHGLSCQGLGPAATGCNNDAYTPSVLNRRFDITTPEGIRVRLRYSPSCRAAWARIDGADAGDRVRVHSSASEDIHFPATVAAGATSVYTRMVNDAGPTAWACVREDRNQRLTCTDRY